MQYFDYFFKIDQCSDILLKRSRPELSINVTERRSILKNYQHTYYPRVLFTHKMDSKNSLKQVSHFYCSYTV